VQNTQCSVSLLYCTKVPILTPEALSAGHASAYASGGRGGGGAWQQVEGDGAWEVELNRLLSTIGEYMYVNTYSIHNSIFSLYIYIYVHKYGCVCVYTHTHTHTHTHS
jgi:hypothetical protein